MLDCHCHYLILKCVSNKKKIICFTTSNEIWFNETTRESVVDDFTTTNFPTPLLQVRTLPKCEEKTIAKLHELFRTKKILNMYQQQSL